MKDKNPSVYGKFGKKKIQGWLCTNMIKVPSFAFYFGKDGTDEFLLPINGVIKSLESNGYKVTKED